MKTPVEWTSSTSLLLSYITFAYYISLLLQTLLLHPTTTCNNIFYKYILYTKNENVFETTKKGNTGKKLYVCIDDTGE